MPEIERRRLVKLVRDDVARFITSPTIEYRAVPTELHVELLRGKLMEEATEYLLRPSIGEAADVIEAIRGLAVVDLGLHNVGAVALKYVIDEADEKYRDRGGFEEGIGMYAQANAPLRHEGEHR